MISDAKRIQQKRTNIEYFFKNAKQFSTGAILDIERFHLTELHLPKLQQILMDNTHITTLNMSCIFLL